MKKIILLSLICFSFNLFAGSKYMKNIGDEVTPFKLVVSTGTDIETTSDTSLVTLIKGITENVIKKDGKGKIKTSGVFYVSIPSNSYDLNVFIPYVTLDSKKGYGKLTTEKTNIKALEKVKSNNETVLKVLIEEN